MLRATLLLLAILLATIVRAQPETAPPCKDSDAVAAFASARAARWGAALRALAGSEKKLAGRLVVRDPEGQPVGATNERRGGPPYWWYVEIKPEDSGTYRAILRHGARQAACHAIEVDDT